MAALKLMEIFNGVEAVQDGRTYIARINALLVAEGTGDDFRSPLDRAISNGSNVTKTATYVEFT